MSWTGSAITEAVAFAVPIFEPSGQAWACSWSMVQVSTTSGGLGAVKPAGNETRTVLLGVSPLACVTVEVIAGGVEGVAGSILTSSFGAYAAWVVAGATTRTAAVAAT